MTRKSKILKKLREGAFKDSHSKKKIKYIIGGNVNDVSKVRRR